MMLFNRLKNIIKSLGGNIRVFNGTLVFFLLIIQGVPILGVNIFSGDRGLIEEHCLL